MAEASKLSSLAKELSLKSWRIQSKASMESCDENVLTVIFDMLKDFSDYQETLKCVILVCKLWKLNAIRSVYE
jgi:hypothetical protein